MADYPPFMNAYGSVTKILDKIKEAKTPDRFSQDFLATVLGFKGGSYKAFIPLAKRIGMLSTDGSPTELYQQFRNPAQSQQAMAKAIKKGYPQLFSRNEYADRLDKKSLEGLIMEATGLDKKSTSLNAIVNTFEALKAFANFELDEADAEPSEAEKEEASESPTQIPLKLPDSSTSPATPHFSYSIYLNLPDTTDIAVFNAIFKSLKDNLIQ